MSKHSSTSSDSSEYILQSQEAEMDFHEEVSSEVDEMVQATEQQLTEAEFEGVAAAGLEEVEGFDASYALSEGSFGEEVEITDDLENLPMAGAEEFMDAETICGRDDRVRIDPTSGIPWRWICQLIITRADGGQSRCTGWFIGPRTVMTSGHCVFSHASGGWARQIEVIPSMNGSLRPFGAQVGTSFRSVRGWTRDRDQNYDYGAIILPNNALGNRVGWFGFASLSNGNLNNLLVNNSGYPGDKPFGTQWFNAGRITKVTDRMLEYMIDTAGGQSGSPIWRYSNGRRHAVSVHGYGGCPNKAVRINRSVFDNMVSGHATVETIHALAALTQVKAIEYDGVMSAL